MPVASVSANEWSTIDGLFSGGGPIGPGATLNLTVAGRGGVPLLGVDAVALNVTATNPASSSFLTVWPTGATKPTASNLNFSARQTIPNMVIAKVGSNGQVSIYNLSGTVDVLADVLGWFPTGGSYTGVSPARLLETRPGLSTVDGQFNGTGSIGPAATSAVSVVGRGGVPASGVDAVALNVTATNPTASSYLTVWPNGAERPTASNLNFTAGDTVPNMVVAKVAANGKISIFNFAGSVDVIVDVLGWFPVGGSYTGLSPARLLETRPGLTTIDAQFAGAGPIAAGGTVNLTVTGRATVPSSGVDAVALNVTATGSTASTFLTVWPAGGSRPTASNLNVIAGQTIPNMVIAKVGTGGQISIFNLAGNIDVVVDVLGWFPVGGSYTGLTPARLLDSRGLAAAPTPPPAQTLTFQPGVYVVNAQIPPGRYTADAAQPGCRWDRLSGFGGSFDETIAYYYQMVSGPRMIVDILPTDAGFSISFGCGALKAYVPPANPVSTIVPGDHVVGQDINAGTYTTHAAAGCYTKRLRSFDWSDESFITDDWPITEPAQLTVTISPTDVGFSSSQDCGTWIAI